MASAERKDFAATKQLRGAMGAYFQELDRGPEEGKKTAWCTSVGPAELLHSLGFRYFLELINTGGNEESTDKNQ